MKWVVDPWNSTQTSGSRKYARTKAVYIACKPKCCTIHKDLVCDRRVCTSLTECYSFIADHVIESHDVFMRSVAVGEKYSTDILANHIGSPSSAFHFWLAENFLKVHSPAALQMSSCLVVCALSVWPDYILMCVGWLPMQTPSVQTLVISADVDRQGLQSRLVSGWRKGRFEGKFATYAHLTEHMSGRTSKRTRNGVVGLLVNIVCHLTFCAVTPLAASVPNTLR